MMTTARTLDLDSLRLDKGAHEPDGQFCVMEAVAYVAGESWTDSPRCASEVIGGFLRAWNDAMDDVDRQMLVPLIPRLVGTAASEEVELRRSWMALDWYCRVSAPRWLRAAGLHDAAAAVEATAPIVDGASAAAAQGALMEARKQAAAAGDAARAAAWAAARAAARAAAGDAAWDAAWAAARDAAGAAARAAAGDAAWDAAWAAAWDAAWAAARAAAGDAAWDAAGAALRPVVVELQRSALELVERMIACGQEAA
jgi:hypothetical protein